MNISEDTIKVLRERYRQTKPKYLNDGMALLSAIDDEGYGIECQRLAKKILANWHQIHGSDNQLTKTLEQILEPNLFFLLERLWATDVWV